MEAAENENERKHIKQCQNVVPYSKKCKKRKEKSAKNW